jgi:hypothetical protein
MSLGRRRERRSYSQQLPVKDTLASYTPTNHNSKYLKWTSQSCHKPARVSTEHRLVCIVLFDFALVDLANLDVVEGGVVVEPTKGDMSVHCLKGY